MDFQNTLISGTAFGFGAGGIAGSSDRQWDFVAEGRERGAEEEEEGEAVAEEESTS
jgi:hypothetical protein